MAVATFALLLDSADSRADDDPNPPLRIDLRVGESMAVDVHHAMGLHCDDVEIIAVDLRAHDFHSNWLYVTGRTPGVTQCRTGTSEFLPSYLFRITVRR